MKNTKVRQAISYALDRNEIIDSAYGKEDFQPAKSKLYIEE